MKALTRWVLDVCARVLSWTDAHPDDEQGFNVLVTRLKALVARMTQLIADQRNGLLDSRAASGRKHELRREILSLAIAHLAQIGSLAAREVHELGKTFRFNPAAETFLAFQSAARPMFEEAQAHKQFLVSYGLSESVLEQFGKQLDEFDAVLKLGLEGRTVHTAATRELDALTREARRILRAMDAHCRQRFQNDRQALELWISARTVLGAPRTERTEISPSHHDPTPHLVRGAH
jgi:hypothetical protein